MRARTRAQTPERGGSLPEGGLAGAVLLAVLRRTSRCAHVALGEAGAGIVHLLAHVGLLGGGALLVARGLALELVVIVEAHGR
jgi:hypothetical protein